MGRLHRIQYEGALYHVFSRGNRKERIFEADRDYRTFEDYMIETAIATGARPRCWYPMANHLHLMIETPLANISEFMQRWLGRYARYYNWVHGKVGHLFQGRFGSRLVQSDAYQKELIRYIHLNPDRANSHATDPLGDRYSSHRYYIGETCPPLVRPWIEPMLNLFGDTVQKARKTYAQFLADGLKNNDWKDFYKPTGDILGDETFVHDIQKRYLSDEDTSRNMWKNMDLDDVLKKASELFGVSSNDLESVSQRRDLGRVRQAVAYIARRKIKTSAVEVARRLGRDHSAINKMLIRADRARPPELERLLTSLDPSNIPA